MYPFENMDTGQVPVNAVRASHERAKEKVGLRLYKKKTRFKVELTGIALPLSMKEISDGRY